MSSEVRSLSRPLCLTILLCLAPFQIAHAANFDETVLSESAISQLETRAAAAEPREQCFLYAELVHSLTEVAGDQLRNGQDEQAGTTLHRIDTLSQKIHMSLARDSKRLKNTELLMQHTTRRLTDMLHITSSDDRAVLQSTLKRLDEVHNELLTQVFVH